MKKSMLLLSFYLLILCIRCNTEGHRGVSLSISDSKERKTYLYTCSIFTSSEKTDDYLLPNIKEVFVEKSWFVGKPVSTHDPDFLNLAIITNNDTFFEKHVIGDFTFTQKNTLILRMNRSMLSDTLRFGLHMRADSIKLSDVYIVKEKN